MTINWIKAIPSVASVHPDRLLTQTFLFFLATTKTPTQTAQKPSLEEGNKHLLYRCKQNRGLWIT